MTKHSPCLLESQIIKIQKYCELHEHCISFSGLILNLINEEVANRGGLPCTVSLLYDWCTDKTLDIVSVLEFLVSLFLKIQVFFNRNKKSSSLTEIHFRPPLQRRYDSGIRKLNNAGFRRQPFFLCSLHSVFYLLVSLLCRMCRSIPGSSHTKFSMHVRRTLSIIVDLSSKLHTEFQYRAFRPIHSLVHTEYYMWYQQEQSTEHIASLQAAEEAFDCIASNQPGSLGVLVHYLAVPPMDGVDKAHLDFWNAFSKVIVACPFSLC